VLCANFLKFGRREMGEIVRCLSSKKFRPLQLSLLRGSRPKSARANPNEVLRVLQILSKSVHFRRSFFPFVVQFKHGLTVHEYLMCVSFTTSHFYQKIYYFPHKFLAQFSATMSSFTGDVNVCPKLSVGVPSKQLNVSSRNRRWV